MRKPRLNTFLLTIMVVVFALMSAVSVSALPREPGEGGGGMGGGGGGGGGGGTTTSSSTGDPLKQSAYWQSSNGGREMTTNVTLQRAGTSAGKLDVVTRTKNNVKLTGFTGGVFLLLRDANGAVIGATGVQKFGVDGQWVGRYDRTDYWSWSVDQQVAAATKSIEIIQQHYAKDLDERLAHWQREICGNLDRLGLPKPPYGCPQ